MQKFRTNLVLIGDSIFANMERHCPLVWDDHFCDEPRLKSPTNLGIFGDKIQNVWYRIRYRGVPRKAKNLVLHVGTNNIEGDSPHAIVQALNSLVYDFNVRYPDTKLIVSGVLVLGLRF